jgi:hypothetical protein
MLRLRLTFSLLTLCAGTVPALAHHSFAAEYDDSKPIRVTGTVTKVEWQNPHIWFYVDVKGEDGKVVNYAFSGGAPGQLMRRGIMRSAIQAGMTVTVDGFKAKDGRRSRSRTGAWSSPRTRTTRPKSNWRERED